MTGRTTAAPGKWPPPIWRRIHYAVNWRAAVPTTGAAIILLYLLGHIIWAIARRD
jgi:hypothetical protein